MLRSASEKLKFVNIVARLTADRMDEKLVRETPHEPRSSLDSLCKGQLSQQNSGKERHAVAVELGQVKPNILLSCRHHGTRTFVVRLRIRKACRRREDLGRSKRAAYF